MFVQCLVSLYIATGLASSPGLAAAPSGTTRLENSGRPAQSVVLVGAVDQAVSSHDRVVPRTGLISVGNPPSKLVEGVGNLNGLISVGNPGNPPKIHGRGVPSTGLISVGNPPSKIITGLISVGNPPSKILGSQRPPRAGGHARSVTWIARDGHELTLALPAGLDLSDIGALVAPAGEWTDVSIAFDGELYLDGDVAGVPFGLSLDMDTWDLPLDAPLRSTGDAQVVIDLELPELVIDATMDQDGLIVEPGDALYDAVFSAVKDAAIARAR